MVLNGDLPYLLLGDVEAFAYEVALRLFRYLFSFVICDCRFERFPAHDRTVHLLVRKAAEEIGDILI
jgi:hypothetical protein